MSEPRLRELIERLRLRGMDDRADAVDGLERAVDALERPPGVIGRVTSAAREEAARQWRLAVEEWGESREALRLVRERMGGRRLEPEEADAVRHQALDLLRTVPAGALAAASALVPLPGFMLVTPWMLRRLGLLPSRWREEALLRRLQDEARELRARGEDAGADALDDVAEAIEGRLEEREALHRDTALRTHWDLDGDGVVSGAERASYDAEVGRLAAEVGASGPSRHWFLMLDGDVFGPVRFAETADADPGLDLLVCARGTTGWVRLADVRARLR